MAKKFEPSDLVQSMNPESLRIHAPSDVVFLCGGVIDDESKPVATLRDAFFRLTKAGALVEYKIVLAEAATPLTTEAGYGDLLSFESDIAQVVALILLFAESPGSLAELGAFAAMPTIAPSLMAVLDDYYYSQSSFIRNGPIKFLERTHGDEWVLVLDRKEVGIAVDTKLKNLDLHAFSQSLVPEITKRLKSRKKWQKFDPKNSGHIILLITGLCQEYGALMEREIRSYLEILGVSEPRMHNFLYCAELLSWIKKVKKGNHSYYVSLPGETALDYQVKSEGGTKDKLRWRSDIRAYWKEHDGPRLRGIAEAQQPMVPLP